MLLSCLEYAGIDRFVSNLENGADTMLKGEDGEDGDGVTLSMNHHGMSPALYLAIEYIDVVFTLLFDVEMILKIVGLGFKRYWTVAFNRMDTLVNITCTIALVFFFAGIEGEGMGLIKVFRLTRVLRVMRVG